MSAIRPSARRLVAAAAFAIGALALSPGCASTGGSGASSADTSFYGGSIQVTAAGGLSTVALAKIDEIKQVAGVKTAFPTYRFDAGTGAVQTAGVAVGDTIVASDPTEAAWSSLKTEYAQGHAIDADSSSEVVLGSAIAKELRKAVGDTVDLPLHPAGGTTGRTFKVVGVLDVTHTGPDQFAYVNITDGQMLLGGVLPAGTDITTVATAIDVFAKPGSAITDLDKIADQINKQVTGVKAIRPSELVDSIKSE